MTVARPSAVTDSTGAAPVRVVVVDDSAVQRRFARAAIEADPDLLVVGEARNGRDAVALVERLRPDVVVMDLHLPGMNGLEAIERIMAARPTPILVFSAFVDGDDRDNAVAALAAGAVDVMEKPGADGPGFLDEYAAGLRRRLRVAGRVKVITHPRGRLGAAGAIRRTAPVRVVAIGASTGGPQALAVLLAELPAETDAAVVVVQHMADGFVEGLAQWLDGLCPLPVRLARTGTTLQPGTVVIAPSGYNLEIAGEQLHVVTRRPPDDQHHVPSVDVTFASIADAVGSAAVGVLLTGMGRDGAAGLRRLRDTGAATIAQDAASCAVYGMPAAAVALDAVDLQLPLDEIAAAVRRALAPREVGAQ